MESDKSDDNWVERQWDGLGASKAYDREGNLDALRLQEKLNGLAGPGEKVAVVSWADYDVPMGGQEAAEFGRAQDGGKGLTEFTEKLNVMGMPSDKMSVVAHSYGSTTTGYGMQSGMDVGNVIVIGSPGMGGGPTQTRDDLGAPDTEVWVGRAWNDPVAAFSAHGRDPGHPLFGAKLFSTSGSSGHSHYFDDDTDSQANLALLALDQRPIKEERPRCMFR